MSFSYRSMQIVCSFVIVTALAGFVFADTIRLKDGSIIKGHIASFSGGKFIVEVGEGARAKQLTFNANEIESITFDPTASQTTKPTTVHVTYTKTEQSPTTPPKVIVTDNTLPTPKPVQSQPQSQSRPQTQPQSIPSASGNKMPPIELNTKVLADNTSNGWTNSGWVVRKGQRIRISGEGNVSLGKGKSCSPSGDSDIVDERKLLKSVPTGALIAVIGDDNNEFIYIGATREFTATRDGTLFLGINEGNLNDNSGSFSVKIEIIPDTN